MTVVVIAGGSHPAIVEFVCLAKNFYGEQLQFVVFDKADNIDLIIFGLIIIVTMIKK